MDRWISFKYFFVLFFCCCVDRGSVMIPAGHPPPTVAGVEGWLSWGDGDGEGGGIKKLETWLVICCWVLPMASVMLGNILSGAPWANHF
jgi:hypothetical protein